MKGNVRCKRQRINRVKVVNWPTTLAQIKARFYSSLDESYGIADCSFHAIP